MPSTPNTERKTLILTGRLARYWPCDRQAVFFGRLAGDNLLAPAVSPKNCPWEMGPEDHIQVDLADQADTERAIAEMRERLEDQGQRLNALVNNAAISPKGEGRRAARCAIDTPISDWQCACSRSIFLPRSCWPGACCRELERANGAVVNVSSIVGSRVHPFAGAAYGTSKAALAALTREMAHEFGRRNVRVNAISPGEIDTSILSPGTEKIVREQIPMQRLGETAEVAKAIYFLCTDQSSYVNGAELHINGGQHV